MSPQCDHPQSQSADESLLSSEQLAAKLNISSRCVLNWLYAGIIPAVVRVGKVVRFREEDVMEALEQASAQGKPSIDKEEAIQLALWLAAPDIAEEPRWLMLRDPSEKETKMAAELSALFFNAISQLKTQEERRKFCSGAVDAAYLDKHFFK